MAQDNSDQSDDEFVNIDKAPGDVEAKVVDGLMTADLCNYDIIAQFPNFANNLQVIRMSTSALEDINGESSKIPRSFCQMKCLKELFLFGDSDKRGFGLSNLPSDFGKLTSLEVLNLEHNCFNEFPEQICDLVKLTKLYLNGCKLTCVSPRIQNLCNLLEVDLSDNDFSSGLCKELFVLPKLKDLYLMNCCLSYLSEEVGNLVALEGLRVNDNLLKEFPDGLYTMKHLKKLSAIRNKISKLSPKIIGLESLSVLLLGENELTSLPSAISKLIFLKLLDVFGNRLTCLPDSVKELDSSLKIKIHGNEFLHKPPLSICTKGIDSIKGFFTSIAKTDTIHSNRIKIVMLGESEAGKTHLTHALVNCKACEMESNDSTIGVEIHCCIMGEERLEACIVDCAGQRRYQLTHPFFLSEEALHVIVVNLRTYQATQESFKNYVEDWINWVTARLWKPRIMIVATHKDELEDDEVKRKCKHILAQVQEHEKKEIKRLDKEIKAVKSKKVSPQDDREGTNSREGNLRWLRNNRPFISSKLLNDNSGTKGEKGASLNLVAVSSIRELEGLIPLRKEICRVARCKSQTTTCSSREAALFPLVGIELPKSWVDLEKAVKEYRNNPKPGEVPCMTKEQFDKFAYDKAGLEGNEVSSGLNYLDSVGEIKYYQIPDAEYSVFLDLPWLCKLVKLLFRHDYEEDAIQFDEDFSEFGMEKVKFEQHLDQLKTNGRLSVPLLRCIWKELELNDVEFDKMIRGLLTFGLACEIPGMNDELFIPWFLHSELKPEEKEELFPNVPPKDKVELRLKFCTTSVEYLPTSLFDRLCVRCYALGKDVITWKNSMLIYQGDIEIYLEVVQSTITVTGRAQSELRQLWIAILEIKKELCCLLSEWPRIVYNVYTVCPHCIKKKTSKPYHFEHQPWVEHPTSLRCRKNAKKHMVEVDLLFPPKELFKRSNPTTLPDFVPDGLLRELSMKIPNHWESLGTFLGVSNERIQAIKQDNIGHVNEQAYSMLISWKETKSKQATCSALTEALKKSEREDLVTFVLKSV